MFADYIKMAAKVVAISLSIALIVTIVSNFTFPAADLGLFQYAIGKGKAILIYYCQPLLPVINLGIGLIGMRLFVIPTIKLGLIGYKVLLKVNE